MILTEAQDTPRWHKAHGDALRSRPTPCPCSARVMAAPGAPVAAPGVAVIYTFPPCKNHSTILNTHAHNYVVEKDLDASIVWFWEAINSGDKVDSALKDMAIVMKQRGRADEAVEAVKSLRHLCPKQSQESLNNILIDLYKASGRLKEEIALLKQKLRKIYLGETFNGKTTKRARSHGRTIHVSVKQETSRVMGNLAWAYMQQANYMAADAVYRKAQMIDADANKACNLALCLIKQGRLDEAESILIDVLSQKYNAGKHGGNIARKAEELLGRIRTQSEGNDDQQNKMNNKSAQDDMMELLDIVVKQWTPYKNKRLPIFEEISPLCREQIAC